MIKKTKILASVIILAMVVVAVIWAFTSTNVQNQEPLKIGVIVYPGFAPFFIADEKDFFEKEDVNAEVVLINDPNQAISLLESNQVHLLFSSADFTAIISDAGVDMKEIFASDIGYGSDGLLVKDDVNDISDLKGKTVYLGMGYPSHFLFRYLTKQAGLKNDDVTLIDMGADQVGAAFVAGQIDYGMSWEPWLSQASEREDGKLLFSSKDEPGIITDTFVIRTNTLNSRNEDVKAVVRAWFDSIDFINSNPSEANSIMAKNMGLSVADFEAQASTIKFLSYQENLNKFNKATSLNLYDLTDKAIEIYTEDGILQGEVSIENIIDSSVLNSLYN
ncbi:ABC transporter substrate-binding protein [Candidatus Woesearchaeota archaeon]|nr:ABC transporter substrate-binding protein [Candidatus Woesearchaeota archaeon]